MSRGAAADDRVRRAVAKECERFVQRQVAEARSRVRPAPRCMLLAAQHRESPPPHLALRHHRRRKHLRSFYRNVLLQRREPQHSRASLARSSSAPSAWVTLPLEMSPDASRRVDRGCLAAETERFSLFRMLEVPAGDRTALVSRHFVNQIDPFHATLPTQCVFAEAVCRLVIGQIAFVDRKRVATSTARN